MTKTKCWQTILPYCCRLNDFLIWCSIDWDGMKMRLDFIFCVFIYKMLLGTINSIASKMKMAIVTHSFDFANAPEVSGLFCFCCCCCFGLLTESMVCLIWTLNTKHRIDLQFANWKCDISNWFCTRIQLYYDHLIMMQL